MGRGCAWEMSKANLQRESNNHQYGDLSPRPGTICYHLTYMLESTKGLSPVVIHCFTGGKIRLGDLGLSQSCDGWFYVFSWLGFKDAQRSGKIFLSCISGYFQKRLAFAQVDWEKLMALPSANGLHPIHWGQKSKGRGKHKFILSFRAGIDSLLSLHIWGLVPPSSSLWICMGTYPIASQTFWFGLEPWLQLPWVSIL